MVRRVQQALYWLGQVTDPFRLFLQGCVSQLGKKKAFRKYSRMLIWSSSYERTSILARYRREPFACNSHIHTHCLKDGSLELARGPVSNLVSSLPPTDFWCQIPQAAHSERWSLTSGESVQGSGRKFLEAIPMKGSGTSHTCFKDLSQSGHFGYLQPYSCQRKVGSVHWMIVNGIVVCHPLDANFPLPTTKNDSRSVLSVKP